MRTGQNCTASVLVMRMEGARVCLRIHRLQGWSIVMEAGTLRWRQRVHFVREGRAVCVCVCCQGTGHL